MVSVDWSAFSGDRPDYFNPYNVTYPVAPPETWSSGGAAAWPPGSGPETGRLFVVGSDDLSSYDPTRDKLIFGFREGNDVTEMNAHNYAVLWEEQADGLLTLHVMPASSFESALPIATIEDLDPAQLSTMVRSWGATNNHFQDDLMASVYSLDPEGGWPDNHIAVQTHFAGRVTTYDFRELQAEHGDDLVLNFVVMTGRELHLEYDEASRSMTISHFGASWGGYNDVWGKTVITDVSPGDLDGLDQLWRYDAALEDGRLLKDRFNGELDALVDAGVGELDPPIVSVVNRSGIEGADDVIRFRIDLSEPSDDAVVVTYETRANSALAGEDFEATSGSVTISAGETRGFVEVRLLDDAAKEADERFFLDLTAAEGAEIGDGRARGLIVDDDDLALVKVINRKTQEGEGAVLSFRVTLSKPTAEDVTVHYQTQARTATADLDYVSTSGRVTIEAGKTEATIEVEVLDDEDLEAQESFFLDVIEVEGAAIGDGRALGKIDDDEGLPLVKVVNRSIEEAEGAVLSFRVELSEAAADDVVLRYETLDSTALAGEDYRASSGKLTIEAGETQAFIDVPILDDEAAEATERFFLTITEAKGAKIDDGTARGLITDDDDGTADPRVTIADIAVPEGDPGGGGTGLIASGPLSTSGNQILDSAGSAVEIRAVSWFGLETELQAPHGLWARNWQEMMEQIKAEGFNAIRLPFSSELVLDGSAPSGIDFGRNPDLQGLSGLEIMDQIVAYADDLGLKILLDHHRSEAGSGANGSGLWYEGAYDEADWIDVWTTLAARYAGDDTVIGADIHNEPHGPASWGDDSATDWAAAAERAGNAIHAVNPDWLIVVEGIGSYQGNNYWWGGNLQGVADRPVVLDQDDKLVYSPHDYPASVFAQPWFFDGSDLTQVFDEHWGYIFREDIAPILLGEFGSRLETQVDRDWAEAIVGYLNGDLDGDGASDLAAGQSGMSWSWWSWNPNSGDTGGVLEDDWISVRQEVVDLLEPLLAEEGGGDAVFADFEVRLDGAAAEELAFDVRTQDGTATAGEDYRALSEQLVFQPGEISKILSVPLLPDTVEEGDETFSLIVTGPDGSETTAIATILDDDQDAPPPPPPGRDDFSFEIDVVNDWGNGAQLQASLTNETATAADGWAVAIDFPFEIVQIWDAEVAEVTGERYLIDEAPWNGSLQPGESVSFGFIADQGGIDLQALRDDADVMVFFD